MIRKGALRRGPWALLLVVASVRAEDPPEVRLDEVVVRTPRAEAPADPTASATIVSAERFEGEAKDVAALVATAPGVAIQEYGGLGQLSTVSIRGSTADGVLVLLDGVPLNTAFGGGVDLASIPRAWIGSIEVVRGVEGAALGSGALGGAVNVLTRAPAPGAWSAEVSSGAFGTWGGSAEGAWEAGGFRVLASGGADLTGGRFPFDVESELPDGSTATASAVRTHNGAARGGLLVRAARPLGAARLDLVLQASAGRREIPAQAPQLDRTSTDLQEDGRVLAAARLVRPGIAPGLDVVAGAHLRADLLDVSIAPADPARQRGGAVGAEAEATLAHARGALRLAASGDLEAVRAAGLGGERARPTVALSASDELSLAGGRLRLGPAARLERVGDFGGASWKLGGRARIAGPFGARASAGGSFRAPSLAELFLSQGLVDPNPDLVPEQGLGADVSIGYDGALGLASVGAHATRYRDLVVYEVAGPSRRLRPRNVGEALLRGLEVEVATAPARRLLGLSVQGSYTLLESENLRAPPQELGKDLPRRPRHRLFARAAVAPGPFQAHLEAHFVGRQWEDARNVNAIDSALVWNAGASARIGRAPALRVSLEVRNLADDRTLRDPLGNPLPGRMVLATVRASRSTGETP